MGSSANEYPVRHYHTLPFNHSPDEALLVHTYPRDTTSLITSISDLNTVKGHNACVPSMLFQTMYTMDLRDNILGT